ncbi:hypothetical protein [Xanthomonas retroflexus]|uniref:hypothetical protein n=1 Tax=Stenotrophomonas indicatrix TaxID=2045451 RepID=UPI000B447D32
MDDDLVNLPDLTISDLSMRVRHLEASKSAMETMCMALIASHPDPAQLRQHWDHLRTQADVAAMEMWSMSRSTPTHIPSPENEQFVQDALHHLDRWLRLTLDQTSS